MNAAFEQFRLAELAQSEALLRSYVGSSAKILEIGSGTGWQARALAEHGYDVVGVDLPPSSALSNHARARVWPIVDYDGVHLPFADQSFDAIYSSNVLEHVTELEGLNQEMLRVLRPSGIALHLLPNPQWRLLSLATYYPGQAIDGLRVLRRQLSPSEQPGGLSSSQDRTPNAGSLFAKIKARLLPPTHGAIGSALGELTRFSRAEWDRFFTTNGWTIVSYGNNGLLASGDYLFGRALPITARKALGAALGGIAHVYVLRRS